MPRRSRKLAWLALADSNHRHSESGVAVIASLSMDDREHPIRLRLRLEHEPDRLIVALLTEAEARKMAEDVAELLAVSVRD